MENEKRIGRQTPTTSHILPYSSTEGPEAVDLYNSTGRTAQEWQELMLYDILAVNDEGLWVHTKFGYSVPRRNGKNEVVAARELYGLIKGERILHTAHRTTTSSSASRRLVELLKGAGYQEVIRVKKGEVYEKAYVYSKQFGLEKITLLDTGGVCDFRTRTSKGGLGEGFDLLIIDEAQEYQDDQETSLKYVVSDSANPQTIFCGTPPTPVSSGTVFVKLRRDTLEGKTQNTGWAEWSVETMSDVHDVDLWYETNPSMGSILTERKVSDEIGNDDVDFNIQRLGLWLRYNQKSAITPAEWATTEVPKMPPLTGRLFVGVKFGRVDPESAALSVACYTKTGEIFVECIDCRPLRDGVGWIVDFIDTAFNGIRQVVADGANGQGMLEKALKEKRLHRPLLLPTVRQVIEANAAFESGVFNGKLLRMDQPSLTAAVTNCEKRAIGNNGGFGYKSIKAGVDIALLDSVALAYWAATEGGEKATSQKISY